MLSDCKFLTFTATAMRFTSLSTDRLPKSSTNNCIVQQFACFFLLFFVFSRECYVILGSAGQLFADGGGLREPSGELQSAAVGRRRTARLAESH